MSIWAVNWALHAEVPNPTHKLVLIALANFADDNDEAWPRVSTLAELASTSTRTVRRALCELEDVGLLARVMGLTEADDGRLRQGTNLYRLAVPDDVSRRAVERVARPARLVMMPQNEVNPGDGDAGSQNETPSGPWGDTHVTPSGSADETPSGPWGDTHVTPASRGDTHVRGGVTPVSPLYKEEPSLEPSPFPPSPPNVGEERDAAGDGAGSDGAGTEHEDAALTVVASAADWELVRSCLPGEMQALDAEGVALVAGMLRERVEAGWSHRDLRDTLASKPLPVEVRNLAGLLRHRLGLIPVAAAPVPAAKPASLSAGWDSDPVAEPAWMQAKREAIAEGRPEGQFSALWWASHHNNTNDSAVSGRN